MGPLDRLSQALTGFSAATAASEATRIRELLEEQNQLLSRPVNSAQREGQAAELTESEKQDYARQYLDIIRKFDFTKDAKLAGLLCPFSMKGASREALVDYVTETVRSSEWVYSDLTDRAKFLISAVNKGIPPESIQRIFALLIASREARGFGIEDDYLMAWEKLSSMRVQASNLDDARLHLKLMLHGQVIDETLQGPMAWYISAFFAPLHPAANIDSRHREGLIRDRKLVFGTKSFYEAARGDRTDAILDFAIRSSLNITFDAILEALPPASVSGGGPKG